MRNIFEVLAAIGAAIWGAIKWMAKALWTALPWACLTVALLALIALPEIRRAETAGLKSRIAALEAENAMRAQANERLEDDLGWLRAQISVMPGPERTARAEDIGVLFRITCYTRYDEGCTGITATGTTATAGRTIAVDPSVIGLGSRVLIEGHEYIAEDVGGAIKGDRIDIFVETQEEAFEKGVDYLLVRVLGGRDE